MARFANARAAQAIIESNFRVVNSPDHKEIKADGHLVPNRDYFSKSVNSAAATKTVTGRTLQEAIRIDCMAKSY